MRSVLNRLNGVDVYACENLSTVCGGEMADVLAVWEVFTITFVG
jgi:hypothetical protein